MNTEPTSARQSAATVLVEVLEEGATLDAALSRSGGVGRGQRESATRSLSFGAVRGYFRYVAIMARLSGKSPRQLEDVVRAILAVALYEIEDARTPEYAVVDAAVRSAKALVPRASGVINAILRRYLRERTEVDAAIARTSFERHAAPAWLAERLRADWPARWMQILSVSDTQPPMWLRVNPQRLSAEAYLTRLKDAGKGGRPEPRVPHAVLLDSPCDVQELPGFAQGDVSVQDLGAQCVSFPLALAAGQRILDACAAPGGKTALMAEQQPQLARLVALDLQADRLQRVRDNLERAGLQAEVVRGDAAQPRDWWDGAAFDRILVDAPCSALGVIRRHPDIKLRKSPADIEKLPPIQLRLLKSAWGMLAPEGRLVYATCTITRSENRDVIARFLDITPDASVVPPEQWPLWPPGLGESDGSGRQILPGEAGADGFYYAALIKT